MAAQPGENAFGYVPTPALRQSPSTPFNCAHNQPVIEIPASNIRILQQCIEKSTGSCPSFNDARQRLFQLGGDVLAAWEIIIKRDLRASEREFYHTIKKPYGGRRVKDFTYSQIPLAHLSYKSSPKAPMTGINGDGASIDRRAIARRDSQLSLPETPHVETTHLARIRSPDRASRSQQDYPLPSLGLLLNQTYNPARSSGLSRAVLRTPPRTQHQIGDGLIIRVKDVIPERLSDLSLPLARDRLFRRTCTVQILIETTGSHVSYLYQNSAQGIIEGYRRPYGISFSIDAPAFEIPSERLEVPLKNANDPDDWHREIAPELNLYIGITFKQPADYEIIIPHIRPKMSRKETRRPATLGAYQRISTAEPLKPQRVALWYHFGDDMLTGHTMLFELSWRPLRMDPSSRAREVESCPPQLESIRSARREVDTPLNIPSRVASFLRPSKPEESNGVNKFLGAARMPSQQPPPKPVQQSKRLYDIPKHHLTNTIVTTKDSNKPAALQAVSRQLPHKIVDPSPSAQSASISVSHELVQRHTSLSERSEDRQTPIVSNAARAEKAPALSHNRSHKLGEIRSNKESALSGSMSVTSASQFVRTKNKSNAILEMPNAAPTAQATTVAPSSEMPLQKSVTKYPQGSRVQQYPPSLACPQPESSMKLQDGRKLQRLSMTIDHKRLVPNVRDYIDLTNDDTPPPPTKMPDRPRDMPIQQTTEEAASVAVRHPGFECKRCGWADDRARMLILHYQGRHGLTESNPLIEELRKDANEERHVPRLVPSIRLQSSLFPGMNVTYATDRESEVVESDPSRSLDEQSGASIANKGTRSLSRSKDPNSEPPGQIVEPSATVSSRPVLTSKADQSQVSDKPYSADTVAVKAAAPPRSALTKGSQSPTEVQRVDVTSSMHKKATPEPCIRASASTPADPRSSMHTKTTPESGIRVSTSTPGNPQEKQAVAISRAASSPLGSRVRPEVDPSFTPQPASAGMSSSKAARKSAGGKHHARHMGNLKRPAPTELNNDRCKRLALSPSAGTLSSGQENKAPSSTLIPLTVKPRELIKPSRGTAALTSPAPPDLPPPLVRHKRKFPVPAAPPGVVFYRTASKRVLITGELLSESDDDVDESALIAEHHALTDVELAHLPHAQRSLIKRLNEHMLRERVTHDGALLGALLRFVGAHGRWMLRKREPRRRLFLDACERYRVWGAVSRAQVGEVVALLDSLAGFEGETEGSSDEEPRKRALRLGQGRKGRAGGVGAGAIADIGEDASDDDPWPVVDW